MPDPVNADNSIDDVKLKWPNDIVFHGRKLGGILAQMVTLPDDPNTVAVIFGVGLNIAVPQEDLPIDAATSWRLITEPADDGGRPPAERVMDLLAARTVRNLEGRLWQFGLNPHGYAQNLRKRGEPTPYGMVLVDRGSVNMGPAKDDSLWNIKADPRGVSVDAFWMDETEVTNSKYKQFVFWVRDSIIRERLADPAYGGNEEYRIDRKSVV